MRNSKMRGFWSQNRASSEASDLFEFLQEFCQLSLLATIKGLHQALNILI